MMTNTQAIERSLPARDENTIRRCLWQIRPDELPEDLNPMVLELWQDGEDLHLFQLMLPVNCDRKSGWWSQVEGVIHFVQKR